MVNPSMELSIITVTYNSASVISDCLSSVASQSFKNVKHIVIDGASTDGTVEILQAHRGQLDALISEPDEGIYDALNKGVGLASGDIVGILNSDDTFFSSDVLKEVMSVFEREPDTQIVFGNVIYSDISNPNKVLRFYSSKNFRPWKLRFGFMPAHTATFIRKSIFEHHGLYRADYESAGDFEFLVRLLIKRSVKYFYLDKTLVNMRLGGMSSSGLISYKRTTFEFIQALQKMGIYTNLFFVLLRLPIKFICKVKFQLLFILRRILSPNE